MSQIPFDEILNKFVAAYKAGDMTLAAKHLSDMITLQPNNEQAWLWLSDMVSTDAERLFCMNKVLQINPENEIALYGLSLLPKGLKPEQPSYEKARQGNLELCTFPGCEQPVTKSGFKFCLNHWKAVNNKLASEGKLNATALGNKFGLSSQRINLVLAELGWITKVTTGWVLTPQGIALGANQRVFSETGNTFALWPESILTNNVLIATLKNIAGEGNGSSKPQSKESIGYREKFPASHRATDGHCVRSKGEMLIDNWLYMSGIAHAYERQLPIEEEKYCDFYIPAGKVYIEYWGFKDDSAYAAKKKAKLELYKKYGFNLIELTDEHISKLDDTLPKLLLKYNIEID